MDSSLRWCSSKGEYINHYLYHWKLSIGQLESEWVPEALEHTSAYHQSPRHLPLPRKHV